MNRASAIAVTKASESSTASVLQRVCACGTPTSSLGDECEECRKTDLGALQPKLIVGSSDDPLEREADRIADQVMRMPEPASSNLERTPGAVSTGAISVLRRKRGADGDSGTFAPASVDRVLRAGGRPLRISERRFFESRFGHDFGQVRVHTDSPSAQSARAVRARAYTVGSHIVFSEGQYAPGTAEGRRLLAHELTHTLQQEGGAPQVLRRVPVSQAEIDNSQTSPGGVAARARPFVVSLFNFGIGSSTIKHEHYRVLVELARLHTARGVRLNFAGHTDSTDTEDVNDRLSHERMMAVVDTMLPLGVLSAGTSAHGESRPAASNASPTGRSRNRRVDIMVDVPPPTGSTSRGPDPDGPGEDTPPPETEDTDWFCAEHPLICALLGGGAATAVYCIMNPLSCLPPIPVPPLGPGGDEGPETPEQSREPECGDPELPLTQVVFHGSGTKGEQMIADPLTRCPGTYTGSVPTSSPTWPTGWECVVAAGQTNRWVRAHLLHGPSSPGGTQHLHGPGNLRENIIISDKSINGRMFTQAEGDAVERVRHRNQVLRYEVTVNHFGGDYPRPYFAESVHIKYGRKNPITGALTPIYDDDITSNVGHQPPQCPPEPSTIPDDGPHFANAPVPRNDGPTISAAPPPGERPPPVLTGLCYDERISCAAADVIMHATFPNMERAAELELIALQEFCTSLQFHPERRMAREIQLRQLADRRVWEFLTWWRFDMNRVRRIGPCP